MLGKTLEPGRQVRNDQRTVVRELIISIKINSITRVKLPTFKTEHGVFGNLHV